MEQYIINLRGTFIIEKAKAWAQYRASQETEETIEKLAIITGNDTKIGS